MKDLQKLGGFAALIEAVTFIVGFALLVTVLAPPADSDRDPGLYVAFLADKHAVAQLWNFIIYVIFGVVLVVLALALHERLRAGAPALMPIATAFGLIWAGLVIATGMVANIGIDAVVDRAATDPVAAASIWLALEPVQEGLGGGNEIVGGLWVLLVSWAALRAGGLPRLLSLLGVVIGVAGVLTSIPALAVLAAIFGLGLIVWFAWLGVVMVRANSDQAVEPAGVLSSPHRVAD